MMVHFHFWWRGRSEEGEGRRRDRWTGAGLKEEIFTCGGARSTARLNQPGGGAERKEERVGAQCVFLLFISTWPVVAALAIRRQSSHPTSILWVMGAHSPLHSSSPTANLYVKKVRAWRKKYLLAALAMLTEKRRI